MSKNITTTIKKDNSWHLLVVLWTVIIALIVSSNILYALAKTIYEKAFNTSRYGEEPQLTDLELLSKPQDDLEEVLISYISKSDSYIAIYIEDLYTNKITSINDHPMPSASLIKLFVAGAYYQAIENGEIVETAYSKEEVHRMLSYSSNDAWVWLEEYMAYGNTLNGITKVNNFASENGYSETGRLIENKDHLNENLTSVNDVGTFLKNLYNNNIVNEEASKTILDHLKNQYHISKIPEGLPEDIASANKTGELDTIQNDAAIIFADNIDYILVVMIDEVKNTQEAIDTIVKISELTYEYMTQIHTN